MLLLFVRVLTGYLPRTRSSRAAFVVVVDVGFVVVVVAAAAFHGWINTIRHFDEYIVF